MDVVACMGICQGKDTVQWRICYQGDYVFLNYLVMNLNGSVPLAFSCSVELFGFVHHHKETKLGLVNSKVRGHLWEGFHIAIYLGW